MHSLRLYNHEPWESDSGFVRVACLFVCLWFVVNVFLGFPLDDFGLDLISIFWFFALRSELASKMDGAVINRIGHVSVFRSVVLFLVLSWLCSCCPQRP